MNVTKQEIETARKWDLLTYLQERDPANLRRVGESTWRTVDHDSLVIFNGKWHWFSRHIGGRTALDYLVHVQRIPFVEAVKMLNEGAVPAAQSLPPIRASPERNFMLPECRDGLYRVRSYLLRRGIHSDVITRCCSLGILKEDCRYGNCIFLGLDHGEPRFGSVRSTVKNIRYDLPGSDKRFSFFIPADRESDAVHVFESAIDAMSYASLLILEKQEPYRDPLLSLSGVYASEGQAAIPPALRHWFDCQPETECVHIHFDNDSVGRQAASSLEETLHRKYAVANEPPPDGKDFNDYLRLVRHRAADREAR